MDNSAVVEDSGPSQKVLWGLNTGGQGGIWDDMEAPIMLSTFEYSARGSLLNWWDELERIQEHNDDT